MTTHLMTYTHKIILGKKMILLGTSKMKKGLFRNGSGNDRDCIKRMVLSFLSLKRSNVTIIFDHEKLLSDLNNTLFRVVFTDLF